MQRMLEAVAVNVNQLAKMHVVDRHESEAARQASLKSLYDNTH